MCTPIAGIVHCESPGPPYGKVNKPMYSSVHGPARGPVHGIVYSLGQSVGEGQVYVLVSLMKCPYRAGRLKKRFFGRSCKTLSYFPTPSERGKS